MNEPLPDINQFNDCTEADIRERIRALEPKLSNGTATVGDAIKMNTLHMLLGMFFDAKQYKPEGTSRCVR